MNTDAAKPADLHFQERFAGAYLRRRHSRNTSSPKGRMHMTTSLQANRWEMLPNTKEFQLSGSKTDDNGNRSPQ